jgi:dTDP-glucose 4,6-dehydratase
MPIALVTGGCGFIGSHFVDELLRRGWTVRVASRPNCGLVNVKHCLDRIQHFDVDITDRIAVSKLVTSDIDAIVHFAALINVDQSREEPYAFLDNNVVGTVNLIEAARQASVKRFVQMSTCEVYGNVPVGRADENHPLNPCSPYAASKFAAERYLLSYANTFHSPLITIIRGFNQYGPRQSAGKWGAVIPKFIVAAQSRQPIRVFGDGSQTRDYVYAPDTVRGIATALETDLPQGAIINLATGTETSIRQIAEKCCLLNGLDPGKSVEFIEARPGELMRSCGDYSKAQRLLGWKPTVDFEKGMKITSDWFAKQKSV